MNKRNVKQSQSTIKKTLDVQHTNKITEIQEIEEQQQKAKDGIKLINKEIEILQELKRVGDISDEQIETLIHLQDQKQDLQRQVDSLGEQLNEIDYYVNVGHTLFKYYDIIEKGSKDDDSSNNIQVANSILKYFVKPSSTNESDEPTTQTDNRASLLDKYTSSIEKHSLP